MPDVKVYIRKENLDKWNSIEKPSEWVNSRLEDIRIDVSKSENIKILNDGTISKSDINKVARVVSEPHAWKESVSDYKVTHTAVVPPEVLRTLPEILADIKELEKSRDEELEYVQDNREIVRIGKEYEAKIKACWEEYHLVKGGK